MFIIYIYDIWKIELADHFLDDFFLYETEKTIIIKFKQFNLISFENNFIFSDHHENKSKLVGII